MIDSQACEAVGEAFEGCGESVVYSAGKILSVGNF